MGGIGPKFGPETGVGMSEGHYSEELEPGVNLSCAAGPLSGGVNISNEAPPTAGGMIGIPSQGCSAEGTLTKVM